MISPSLKISAAELLSLPYKGKMQLADYPLQSGAAYGCGVTASSSAGANKIPRYLGLAFAAHHLAHCA
jgi:hypothetical protein